MAATAPAVSVLMPVYNAEQWLSHAIDSALAQTFADFELVVVDDGSTDGSAAMVESFAQRDPRVRLVRAEHAGEPAARSTSLAEARAPLVAFLDADDEWLPNRLERQLPYVDERTVVFADAYIADWDKRIDKRYSDVVRAPEVQYPASGLFPDLLVLGSFIMIGTVLAPRELLLDAGGFRYAGLHGRQSNPACDWEMWLVLALRGARFHYLDEPLAVYRRHPDQETAGVTTYADPVAWQRPPNPAAADWSRLLDWMIAVVDGLLPEVRGGDRRLVRRAQRHWRRLLELECRKLGWRQIVAGRTGAARRELVRSLRARPSSPRAWAALSLTVCPPLARRVVRGRV